jgi:hypothetical protein
MIKQFQKKKYYTFLAGGTMYFSLIKFDTGSSNQKGLNGESNFTFNQLLN